jgi:hypothetical protein
MVSAGSFELESGKLLAKEEKVIVVRPNSRLSALGWVHFGLIEDGLPDAINLGLQDQIAALNWVSNNTGFIGGDKDNITIGGESCGTTAVSHLSLTRLRAHSSGVPFCNHCRRSTHGAHSPPNRLWRSPNFILKSSRGRRLPT